MTGFRRRSTGLRLVAPLAGLALVASFAAGCSSDDGTGGATEAGDSASAAAGTEEMRALCDQMISESMSPEEANALAEENGYVTRIGTLEGQPQAVTMDYREDRFTFDVEGGVVVSCSYG